MAGLLERRHTVRRALAGGVVLGAAAGLVVAALEVVWVLRNSAASFDGGAEIARFALALAGFGLGAGALVGIVEGLVAAAVTETAAALGDPRRDEQWKARLYTVLAVPPVALLCGRIFAGAHARTIAHHDLYAIAIGVGLLAAWYAALRLWQRLYDERLGPRAAFALAAVAALGGMAAYSADQRVLVRLYPFFHAALGALVFGAAEVALALASLGLRRRLVRLVEPSTALAVGLVALAAGATALGAIGRSRALRSELGDTTVIVAPLVRHVHGAAAAASATAASHEAAPPLPEGPHPGSSDVILITVDAMRADRLSPRTAPKLSALAAHGVVFDRAYAQVPHTSFSIATLLTGKYVYALSALGLDAARSQTLAEVLKRERYKTAAFFPPAVFTIDRERLKPMEDSRYGFEYVKYEFLDATRRTDQVIDFLEREHPAHAFVWVHYFEPHEPYEAHPGHLDDARGRPLGDTERYDSEVHYVDSEAARLIDYVKKTRPHALVILAADHGEEFGEHGGRYHGTTLYEEQVRVPLAFVPLDGALTPHHVAEPVGLIDVAPTILSLLGIMPSARMRGRDLGPWLLPPPPPPPGAHGPVFAEIDQKKMIVDGTHKLICDLSRDDLCRAFDLAADPGERRDRGDEPFARALYQRLHAWMVEEDRYEQRGDDDGRTRKLLDRARLGDAAVTVELAVLLRDPAHRAEVARLIASLPPDPHTREALVANADAASRPWFDLALARLGDGGARARVAAHVAGWCAPATTGPYADELCARAALAVGDVPALAAALERPGVTEPLQIALAHALGRSHDPRALDPLVIHLGQVRTRTETIGALAELDDARVLPTLLLWVPNEPYVPARAAMVSLVAELGRHAPVDARAVLLRLAADEREAPVMAALLRGLHALGAAEVVDLSRGRVRAVAGGELWVAGSGSGALEASAGGAATRVELADGIGHALTPRAGAVMLRRLDGDAAPELAFSRRAP